VLAQDGGNVYRTTVDLAAEGRLRPATPAWQKVDFDQPRRRSTLRIGIPRAAAKAQTPRQRRSPSSTSNSQPCASSILEISKA
jgi:hypothetical protein